MFPRLLCLLSTFITLVRADNTVLDAWLNLQSNIRTLETSFIQERRLPSLKQPITSVGKLSFAIPGRVRWQLGDPAASLALSDGITLTLIDFTAKTARRIPANSQQAARFSLLTGKGFQTPDNFHAMFEVSAHRIESGIHQYTLKPKERQLRTHVPWVFLDIDPATHQLRAMELELQDKSRIRTVFQLPRLNAKLPLSLFTQDLTGLTVK